MINLGYKNQRAPINVIPNNIKEFKEKKIGVFIHWGMTTYRDSTWWSQQAAQPPSPSIFTFNGDSSVFETWAQQFAATGKIKYACLTVKHHYGFRLYPTDYEYNKGVKYLATDNHKTRDFPFYVKYGVDHPSIINSVSQTILEDFCNAMRSYDIEPCFYYSMGHDLNCRGGLKNTSGDNNTTGEGNSISPGYDGTGNFRDFADIIHEKGERRALVEMPPSSWTGQWAQHYEKYFDYIHDEFKYLIQTYSPYMIWADITSAFPYGCYRKYVYDVIKKYDKNCLVSGNNFIFENGTENASFGFDGVDVRFPPINHVNTGVRAQRPFDHVYADIIANEGGIGLAKDDEYDGIPHYDKRYRGAHEIADKVYEGSYWNITGKGNLYSQAVIQQFYEDAKSRGSNLLLNVSPDTDGVISQDQVDLFTNIIL